MVERIIVLLFHVMHCSINWCDTLSLQKMKIEPNFLDIEYLDFLWEV